MRNQHKMSVNDFIYHMLPQRKRYLNMFLMLIYLTLRLEFISTEVVDTYTYIL